MWQRQGSALPVPVVEEAEPAFAPELLVHLEPWHRVFLGNLRDLVWPCRRPPLRLISWPAAPWPDVLVPTRLPWRGLAQSVFVHLFVIGAIWWLSRYLPRYELVVQRPAFRSEDVVYYTPAEYLPPLDTGRAKASQPVKGEPTHAPQPIISVPPEADNHTQTIVTPPDVKLRQDVPLPNMVAWSPKSVAVPMEATARSAANLRIPALTPQVVAPAPDLNQASQRQAPSLQSQVAAPAPSMGAGLQRRMMAAPEASIVGPPPSMQGSAVRRIGDINIGPSEVVAPAPRLPVSEQRRVAGLARGNPGGGGGAAVVAPAPSTQGLGVSGNGGGRIIALSVHPAPPGGPIPEGNRRGTFAATPAGKPGGAGTPDIPGTGGSSLGTNGHGDGQGAGVEKSINGVPPGLLVGEGPKNTPTAATAGQGAGEPKLSASVTPPKLGSESRKPATSVAPENATAAERQVFGNKRFYSMTLNLPNLNSAGGSWIIHFAELQENKGAGQLSGPVARHTSDPAYPLALMRRNIKGTVTLYAVINSDGSVSAVRVLSGVNDQLDEAAKNALLQWQFAPATKNGSAVALEAVVRVPFRPFSF